MLVLRTRLALLLGLTLGSGWPRASAAAPAPFELEWSAPAECPSGDEVSAALSRLAAAGSRVEAASVVIVPLEGRWQATLSTRGAQRRLEGESCAAVVQALTVVLALAAEQAEQEAATAHAEKPPQQTEPPPAPGPSPAAPASSPDPAPLSTELPPGLAAQKPDVSRAQRARLGWSLRMGMVAELGLLPGPSLGPQAALGLTVGAWSFELGGALLLPRRAELEGPTSPRSDIDWVAGQAAVCRSLGRHLSVCLGAELGRLGGTGSGVDEPDTARGWWLAGTAGAHLHGNVSSRARVSWQLGLDVATALERPEFGFDELGVLHRPSAVSGRLFLGLGWGP